MDIIPFESNLEDKLHIFLTKYSANPYAIYGINQDKYANYVLSELKDVVSKGSYVLIAEEANDIIGVISLNRLDWDSQHFTIEMSKIDHLIALGDYHESTHIKQRLISSLLAKCSKELLLHISIRINKEDLSSIHALESKNFKLMDILVTYALDLRKYQKIQTQSKYLIRFIKAEEIPEIEKMAFECFHDNILATDRFHADPTLSKKRSSEVYAEWVVNSIKEPFSKVLVAEIDGKAAGFNVCTINPVLVEKIGLRIGSMALTAVDSSLRNKLVATTLLNSAIEWFSDKVDIIETGGQVSNYPIQKAWTSVGLEIVRSQCTFHWSVLTESL